MTRSLLQIGIAVLGSIGILTPFLPFTSSVSPLRAIVAGISTPEIGFIPIALPFFLAILIFVALVRATVSGGLSRAAAIIALGSSFVMACPMLAFTTLHLASKPPAGDWLLFALPWVTISIGIALLIWLRRRGTSSAIAALLAMQSVYIANATFCLAVFWPEWQSGAIVTAVTAVAYATHIALVIRAARPEHVLHHAFNS